MSDIPTEVNPDGSESPGVRDGDGSADRAPDQHVDLSGGSSVSNGTAHAPSALGGTVDGAAETGPTSNGHVSSEGGAPWPTATPPPRQRRRRVEPRDTQPPPASDGAVTVEPSLAATAAPRRARKPRKKATEGEDGQSSAGAEDASLRSNQVTHEPEAHAAEAASVAADGGDSPGATIDSPDAQASPTLDVPYTPPEAYQSAPDPFANLGAIGGTITAEAPSATVEPPVITAEPMPISVDMSPPPSPPAPPEGAELAGQPAPPPSDDDEFDDEGGTMTIIEHLEELRKRLMWCLGAIAVGSFIGWFFAKPLVELAKAPLIGKADVITLTVFGAFVLQIKMALAVGICLSMPMTLYQVWGFVAPGLTRREKRYARPFVLLGSFLFIFGAAVGYFVFPKGVAFALQFNGNLGIKPTIEANGYVGFIAMIMVLFGIAFELPVFMVFLSLIGLFSSQAMLSRWRAAIVIIWAGAMVVTPGADIVSPVILASILTVLYFLGIWLTRLVGR